MSRKGNDKSARDGAAAKGSVVDQSGGGSWWWKGAWGWPSVTMVGIAVAMMVAMRWEGRRWWCACGELWLWVTDVWTSHCSQHVADPYTFSHVSHGLIFYAALAGLRRRVSLAWRLTIAIATAAAWEVLENSPMVIERYRTATMSLDYLGDSVINSTGDVTACGVGFWIAKRVGIAWAMVVFVVLEVVSLAIMRDNLTLNVIMLVHPVDAIRQWQMVGH